MSLLLTKLGLMVNLFLVADILDFYILGLYFKVLELVF